MKPFERMWSAFSMGFAFVGWIHGMAGDVRGMAFCFIVAVGFAVAADSVAEAR